MNECLEALESSPLSFPSDKLFCQHVRLQHIIEEFELQLAWESSAPVVNSTRESRARSIHKAFMHQLEDWSKAVPQDCWNGMFFRKISLLFLLLLLLLRIPPLSRHPRFLNAFCKPVHQRGCHELDLPASLFLQRPTAIPKSSNQCLSIFYVCRLGQSSLPYYSVAGHVCHPSYANSLFHPVDLHSNRACKTPFRCHGTTATTNR